ncbi:hypothetical protein WJT74_03955 [Sphingomicrobium sp. XHP0239]|uniref:hypothetical protein n=1 Tax=Sphingomicrobium maritimum TaxID=3133972 RepID=UPI0031CCD722
MAIDLTQVPERESLAGDPNARLAELRVSLAELQLRQTAHRQRLILIVEGWEATGKRALLRQILASLDPCSSAVHCSDVAPIMRPSRHWLADYWERLPEAGASAIFYRSWYRRLVEDRVRRDMKASEFSRACDEINEFEAQQRDHDTTIIKFFFHCSEERQVERTVQRLADPWQRHMVDEPETERGERAEAWNALFAETDTRWAPWTLVNAECEATGQTAAMQHLVATLDKALPADPVGIDGKQVGEIVDFPSGLVR